MIYIETGSTDVYYNFGLEYYFTAEKKLSEPVFLFWRTTPTLMIGKYQSTLEEINKKYVDAHNIHIVRRLSGGGTIYTDPGGWQFSFITQGDSDSIQFQQYLTPVLDALQGMGIPAEFNGRNDLTVEGKKFSGNAQYKLAGATVHHGSLLFDTNIEQMVASTTVDEYKILYKSIKSVHDRVTNLTEHLEAPMTAEEFKQRMVTAILNGGSVYQVTEADDRRIRQLAAEHFDNWDKKFGASPKFSMERQGRFAGSRFRVNLNVQQGKIADIAFSGDFFSAIDMDLVRDRLIGCPYRKDAVAEVLRRYAGADGVYGITLDEMVDTIVE